MTIERLFPTITGTMNIMWNSPSMSDSPSTDAFSQQAAWNLMYQRPIRISTHSTSTAQDRPLTCTLFAAGQTPRLQTAAMLASLGRPRALFRACWGSLFGIHPNRGARIDNIGNFGCVPPSKRRVEGSHHGNGLYCPRFSRWVGTYTRKVFSLGTYLTGVPPNAHTVS